MATKDEGMNPRLSRRALLGSMSAIGAAAVLYGCSSDDGGDTYVNVAAGGEKPFDEKLEEFSGGAGRACGGLCVVKAQVKNGVVKRFVSDNIFDENVGADNPFGRLQTRACLKCRSWKYMMYNQNRVTYPLIQRGERGDLSTFEVVSWTEAMSYIKTHIDHIRKNYGPGAVLNEQAGGNGGYGGFFLGLEQMVGGALSTRQDFSQACWEHVANFVRPQRFTDFGMTWAPGAPFDARDPIYNNNGRDVTTGWIRGTTGYNIVANSITDFFQAEHVLLWSGNPAEVFGVHHANYYLKRIQEAGKTFTVVDQRRSPSVTTYVTGDNSYFLSPMQNTDTALILALIYSMLTTHYDKLKALYGATTDAELKAEVEKYIYGFFDTGAAPTSYHEATTIKNQVFPDDFPVLAPGDFAAKYAVPDGMSWSAYIFGTEDTLIGRGLNFATSKYPDKIGYAVRDYDYPGEGADPLKGKYVPCYGKVAKTPAWAEKITGVPAADIEALAERLLTKKTSIYIGFGFQRNHEGEQGTWSMLTLSTLIKSFGAKGQSIGIPRAPGYMPQNDRFAYDKWLPPAMIPNMPSFQALVYGDITAKFYVGMPGGYINSFPPYGALGIDYAAIGFHDTKKVSFPELTDDYTRSAVPIKEIYDMIGATNQDKVDTQVLHRNAGDTDWELQTESVYPSLWNDGQVQRLPKPIKAVFAVGSNKITSNGADVNRTVRVFHETDPNSNHPKKYKVELIVVTDSFMTGSARYADVILPSAATSEKFIAPISTQGNEVVNMLSQRASKPLGNALDDISIGEHYYKQWETECPGITDTYFGACRGDETMSANEKVVKALYENNPDYKAGLLPTYEGWKHAGVAYAPKYASNYGRDLTIPANPATPADFPKIDHRNDVFIWNQEFRLYPDKYPMHSPSGRVEAFCQAMIEDFEARNFLNYDENVTLDEELKFAGTPTGWEKRGRYAYPVPMYIPSLESRHACDGDSSAPMPDAANAMESITGYTKHPNPMGFADGFDYVMCNHHPIQRAHTLHNSNPIINELFKYDAKGEHTFYGADNSNGDPAEFAPKVMTSGVYEPALIGKGSLYADGTPIENGDLVVIESLRGKGMFSAKVTGRIKAFHVTVAQGSAYNPMGHMGNADDVDLGGSTGTHISHRPSRIGRGFTASDIRVRITKGASL